MKIASFIFCLLNLIFIEDGTTTNHNSS